MGNYALLATYSAGAKRGEMSELNALTPYASGAPIPRVSDLTMMATYSTAEPSVTQSLAWQFTMDGHTFYVLDLGNQGTWLFDTTSKAWCKYETNGFQFWNMRNGTPWNVNGVNRVVGADWQAPTLWELDPDKVLDEDFRDVVHAATAGIELRSRVYHSLAELRIAGNTRNAVNPDTAYMQLTYSDDNGQTYSAPLILTLQTASSPDGGQDVRFSSLGAFMAPGRVFQLVDVGSLMMLTGADAMIDDFDETNGPLQG
jgi:hypothetical protein